MITDYLWSQAKKEIIKSALLKVGLSVSSPIGKMASYFISKFVDKFVRPELEKLVALTKSIYVQQVETIKLKMLEQAKDRNERDRVITIIDSLK